MYRDGDLAMFLIRNGYPVSTRRGFLGMLFSALLLLDPGAAIAQEFKQVKLTEPPEQTKDEIAALSSDKSLSEAEKKEGVAQLEAALTMVKPIQFKENIALVLKYFDQLIPFMQEMDTTLRPAD